MDNKDDVTVDNVFLDYDEMLDIVISSGVYLKTELDKPQCNLEEAAEYRRQHWKELKDRTLRPAVANVQSVGDFDDICIMGSLIQLDKDFGLRQKSNRV
jgi:hypothetical protein